MWVVTWLRAAIRISGEAEAKDRLEWCSATQNL